MVMNSTVSNNLAAGNGAGLHNTGLAIVRSSTFFTNTATGNGGAINNDTSTALTVDNSTFYDNRAASGGAFYNANGTLKMINSTLTANGANGSGDVSANRTASGTGKKLPCSASARSTSSWTIG